MRVIMHSYHERKFDAGHCKLGLKGLVVSLIKEVPRSVRF